MSELDRVKSFFASKNIHAATLWMESCIHWCKSEHSQQSIENMLHDIYEQWLICDLRDMEIGSLPENLQSYTKIILHGKYAVQMHYVIDVSQPAYTQLQKLRNKRFIQDEDISDEYKQIQPKRVLSLVLCDGVQTIKGMEYKPIKKLNTSLTPGIKLMIRGPVECREGVLFLEEHNIEILGGEIEDLFVKNAYENVLAREIKLPENPNPFPAINIKNEDCVDLDDVKDEIFDDDLIAQININEITRSDVPEKTESKTETTRIDEYDDYEEQLRDADFDLNEDDYFDINVTEIEANANRNEEKLQQNVTENICQIYDTSENKPSTSSARNSPNQYEPNQKSITPTSETRSKFPKLVSSEPFVYIQQLLANPPENLPKSTYVVKARFKSVVSQLKFIQNQWSLKCEIEDSTGSIVVNFSNSVLEDIFGYTAAEMTIMRRQFKTSNFHKDQVIQALEKAKEKLFGMTDLITLVFLNYEEPTVVSIQPVTFNDLKLLEKRMSL